jgi:hypothetical protein
LKTDCLKCNSQIVIPLITEEHKYEIWGAVVEGMPMWAIKFVMDYTSLNTIESKVLVKHINKTTGTCFNCNYKGLKEENINCPKCRAFNLNWDLKNVLSHEFCYKLERRFELACEDFKDKIIRSFWCDGIVASPLDYKLLSKDNIKIKKHLVLDIWTGVSGHEKFKLKLHFGEQSVFKILNQDSLMECIPELNGTEWVDIGLENELVDIYLK